MLGQEERVMSAKDERNFSPLTELSQGGGSEKRYVLAGSLATGAKAVISAQPRPSVPAVAVRPAAAQMPLATGRDLRQRIGWY